MITKLASILCVFLAFSTSDFPQIPGSDPVLSASELGLKGPVWRVTTRAFPKSSEEEEVYTFDRSGRVTEKFTGGWRDERIVYTYDADGHLNGHKAYKGQEMTRTITIKLDPSRRPAELTLIDHDPRPENRQDWKLTYRYVLNAEGRISERITELNGPIGFRGGFILSFGFPPGEYRETFEYDAAGRKTKYAFYLPKPEAWLPFIRTISSFDEKGRKIEEIVPVDRDDGKPGRTTIESYRYNDNDDVIETRHLEPITESTRKEAGDRFKVLDSGGTVQNGNLVSDRPNHVLWDLMECSYVYDSFRNWTAKSCTLKARDGNIPQKGEIRRTIEYYPK